MTNVIQRSQYGIARTSMAHTPQTSVNGNGIAFDSAHDSVHVSSIERGQDTPRSPEVA